MGGSISTNCCKTKGRFTLWPKVERPSISTNQISRNQEFGLSTLHTRGRSPKSVALFLPTWQHFFDQSDGLSKGVWVVQEWKPKVWSRGRRIFSLKKLDSGRMLEYEYFITYFQPILLDSQQSLATHFHGLSVWTAIV